MTQHKRGGSAGKQARKDRAKERAWSGERGRCSQRDGHLRCTGLSGHPVVAGSQGSGCTFDEENP